MSPNTRLTKTQRREIIRDNILILTYAELAKRCRCTVRTIKRDVRQWRMEGGFEEFLITEFFTLYPTIKNEYPDKAFDRLCYLLGKTIILKQEIKQDLNVTGLNQNIDKIIKFSQNESEADAS